MLSLRPPSLPCFGVWPKMEEGETEGEDLVSGITDFESLMISGFRSFESMRFCSGPPDQVQCLGPGDKGPPISRKSLIPFRSWSMAMTPHEGRYLCCKQSICRQA